MTTLTTHERTSPQTLTWTWRGYQVRYQMSGHDLRSTEGDRRSAIVLIHGFGASSDHWRKNLPILGAHHRVFAIDLIGFGFSDKPDPRTFEYTFETWGQQVLDFCEQVVSSPAYFIGNSIGCIVAMQAAVLSPEQCLGTALLDCSLRLLHERKRQEIPWYQRVSAPLFQRLLSYRPLGHFFFNRIANPKAIASFLTQAYGDAAAITDELVEAIYRPALEPGAADVFLTFIQYSQGPLAEDLLPQLQCPALFLWGEADPWEPIEMGRSLAQYDAVEDFIPLPGVGHCPQDEAPDQVNALLLKWCASHDTAD